MTLHVHPFLKDVHYENDNKRNGFLPFCENAGNFFLIPAMWFAGGGNNFTFVNKEGHIFANQTINPVTERIAKFVLGVIFGIPSVLIGGALKLISMLDHQIYEKHYGPKTEVIKPVNVDNTYHTL